MFIERTKRGKRNHYHFLSVTPQAKEQFREYLIDVLSPRKGVGKHRKHISSQIDLQYEPIIQNKAEDAFAYLAKVSKKERAKLVKLTGRTKLAFGHVWSKATSELGKMTPEETSVCFVNRLMKDHDLLLDILDGHVTPEQYEKANFFVWYSKCEDAEYRRYLRHQEYWEEYYLRMDDLERKRSDDPTKLLN